MAGFWNELGENIAKGVDIVVEKTSEVVDKGKETVEKAKLEREKQEAMRDLGETFYHMMRNDELDTQVLQDKCDGIESIEAKIKAIID